MAFCTSCGAPLEEGKVCSCQQAQASKISLGKSNEQVAAEPQQNVSQATAQASQPAKPAKPNIFTEGLKDILNFFKNVIKKPFDATTEFFDKANPVAAGVLWFVLMYVYVVENFLNTILGGFLMDNYSKNRMIFMSQNSRNFIRALYGKVFNDDMLRHVGLGNYVQAFFFPIMWMICMTIVVFGIGLLINLIFVKGNFKQALCKIGGICGVTSVGLIVIQIIAMIRNVIGMEGVNILFTAAQSIVALFVIVQAILCINKMVPDKNKTSLAVIISVAGLTVADYVLNLFFGYFAPYFMPLAF